VSFIEFIWRLRDLGKLLEGRLLGRKLLEGRLLLGRKLLEGRLLRRKLLEENY